MHALQTETPPPSPCKPPSDDAVGAPPAPATANERESVIKYLLPVISPATSPDVVEKALSTLCHNLEGTLAPFARQNGFEILLDYMLARDPVALPKGLLWNACRLASAADVYTLEHAIRDEVTLHPCESRLDRLILWYTLTEEQHDVAVVFHFVFLLSLRSELLPLLQRKHVVAMLLAHTTKQIRESPTSALLAFKTFVAIVPARASFLTLFFSHESALGLFESVAYHRCMRLVQEGLFFQLTLTLFANHRTSVELTPTVVTALVKDAPTLLFSSFYEVCCHRATLAPHLLREREFVECLLSAYLVEHDTLASTVPKHTLACVAAADAFDIPLSHELLERVFRLSTDAPLEPVRSLLYARHAPTRELLRVLPRLLEDNRSPSFWSDSDDCGVDLHALMDETLLRAWNLVVAEPLLVVRGECVVHGMSPRSLLFHALHVAVGAPPVNAEWTIAGHEGWTCVSTLADNAIRDFVSAMLHDVRASGHLAAGVELYCRDLEETYGIETPSTECVLLDEAEHRHVAPLRASLPTCPITMELMHCPVVLADGVTYEFEAILQVMLSSNAAFCSPSTRTPLEPCVTYNRAVVDADIALCAAVVSLPRARRRHVLCN